MSADPHPDPCISCHPCTPLLPMAMSLQLCTQVIPTPGVGIPMGLALTLEAPSRRAGLPSWLCGQDLTMLPGHGGSPPGEGTGLYGQMAPVGGLAEPFLRHRL